MALLHAIRSPSKPLRHVVGTNVAVIVGVGGLPTWPELLMSFVQCLESNDHNALEGALDALYKVRRARAARLRCARGCARPQLVERGGAVGECARQVSWRLPCVA